MTLYKNVSKVASILILSAIFMATTSMAKDQRKTIPLPGGYTINGAVLKEGDYTIEFSDSEGGDATISRNGKVILITPYHLVQLPEPAKQTAVRARTNSDGVREITSLVFHRCSVASLLNRVNQRRPEQEFQRNRQVSGLLRGFVRAPRQLN